MTTSTMDNETHTGWPMFAAMGAGFALVLTAIGTFTDVNGNDTGQHDSFGQYLIVVGIIAAATAIVFGLVARKPSPTKALVLGILAVVTLVAFWAGLPPVFAAGALACALGSPRLTGAAKAGVGLAAIAVTLAAVAAFVG